MRKIPTLFARDWNGDRRYVLPRVTPGCEWVIAGEGVATRKYDGTCVMFDGERWHARREVREGKPAPSGFVSLGTDEETGKTIGWEPADQSSFTRWLDQALAAHAVARWRPGTYELCGAKVNGNPENFIGHVLVEHSDAARLPDAPREFAALAAWLHAHDYEGIVLLPQLPHVVS